MGTTVPTVIVDNMVQKLYSFIARFYNLGLLLIGYQRAANFFVRQLPFLSLAHFTVLDAGCGTGLYSLAILKRFPNARVVAFDFNKDMLEQFQDTLRKENLMSRCRLFVGNIQGALPEIQEQFDLIVAGGVLEYVDIKRAVKNLSRFQRTSGWSLNSPVKNNIFGKLIGKLFGFKTYSRQENIEAFTTNGYRLENFFNQPWYLPIALVKEAHLFKSTPIHNKK